MLAVDLYRKLEDDFIKPGLSDEWARYMTPVAAFLSDNFKQRSMGLVCDNGSQIERVFTAVFPTRPAMQKLLDQNAGDCLFFVHHPEIWDIRRAPDVYGQMDLDLLRRFQTNRISIYNLHVPLDNYGPYSTAVSLSEKLDLRIERPFAAYYGALAGVIAHTGCALVKDLWLQFTLAMGQAWSFYPYGD